jgi:putative transposase
MSVPALRVRLWVCLVLPATGIAAGLFLRSRPLRGPSPPRALGPAERETVLAHLHGERFQDRSPAAVYATLLDEGKYHCAIRTMYRLLAQRGESRERRDQLTHPAL